jgi:UDP-N-acetylmuramoylalanine-D-glutamate ligase
LKSVFPSFGLFGGDVTHCAAVAVCTGELKKLKILDLSQAKRTKKRNNRKKQIVQLNKLPLEEADESFDVVIESVTYVDCK